MSSAHFKDVQRQITRYLREPEKSPLPQGADARRMKHYARQFRGKLTRSLKQSLPVLISVLGEKEFHSLLDDYARLPRESLSGKTTLAGSFLHYVDSESDNRGLSPLVSELVDFCARVETLFNSDARIGEDDVDREGDLLAGVPVFSELAEVLSYRWPVHAIRADQPPAEAPASPTWLIIYRDRRFHEGYLELNRQAAEIALRIRDNAAGRTGAQLLADADADNPGIAPGVSREAGGEILEFLRKRDIVTGVRKQRRVQPRGGTAAKP